MEPHELWQLASSTLWANRLRSFLTILGTAVSVLSIVAVVSILHGADRYVATEILTTGSDVFTISKLGFILDFEKRLEAEKRRDLTSDDADYLRERLTLADAVVARASTRLDLKRRSDAAEGVVVWGAGPDYPLVSDLPILSGRHFGLADVEGRASVVVLGSKVAETLFGVEDPIGEAIRLEGHRYLVIGVLEERGGASDQSKDELAFIPISSFRKHFQRLGSVDLLIRSTSPDWIDEAKDEAELHLKIRRGLKPYDRADFEILTDDQVFALYESATRMIYAALVGIVSLSLVIGGIVIMNIMLVSVTDRTREIGIRKAIGARPAQIVTQFLLEAIVLSLSGGVLGVGVGVILTWIIERNSPLPAAVQPWSIVVGLLLASSIGVFFGAYPARKASQLSPTVALGYES